MQFKNPAGTSSHKHIIIIPYSVFAYFMILNLIWGLDFGLISLFNKRKLRLAKCVSVFVSLSVITVLILPLLLDFNYWYFMYVIQYVLYFFILKCTYSFYNFIVDINVIDENLEGIRKEIVGIIAFAYTYSVLSLKIGLYFVYRFMLKGNAAWSIFLYTNGIWLLSSDLVPVILIFINYYLYCCVSSLKRDIVNNVLSATDVSKRYVAMTFCYDKIKILYDLVLTVDLIFEMPKFLLMLYYMLFLMTEKKEFIFYFSEGVYAVSIFIRIIIPSIIAELKNREMERIVVLLNQQMLRALDKAESTKLVQILRYMEAHKLKHSLWRLLPVDISLPVTVISVCTTYLIVAIQMTHLYES